MHEQKAGIKPVMASAFTSSLNPKQFYKSQKGKKAKLNAVGFKQSAVSVKPYGSAKISRSKHEVLKQVMRKAKDYK